MFLKHLIHNDLVMFAVPEQWTWTIMDNSFSYDSSTLVRCMVVILVIVFWCHMCIDSWEMKYKNNNFDFGKIFHLRSLCIAQRKCNANKM